MIISDLARSERKLFLRDPEYSELGQKIINHSIKLIDEIGFEEFTFKKLALEINSTEASIYRYFENKHKLLLYLVTWYWSWLKYTIDFQIIHLREPKDKLKAIISVICKSSKDEPATKYVDEAILSRIVIIESGKAYISKFVEQDLKYGLFEAYTEVCNKISGIIKIINPKYPNPKALAITLIDTAHRQKFYNFNLQSLTDLKLFQNDTLQLEEFLENLIFQALKLKKK